MATGTGKTLTAAAIIKLFLRTGNARRVLFLVDRLELEDQALKAFRKVLANDTKSVIYKENRDDWRRAEVVVSTVQSLLFNNKYQQLFSPTDFDLVISDEAHRSIGGNARAVFDYFIGYKLGLTATPFDYLKKFDRDKPTTKDPREFERRLMLDSRLPLTSNGGGPLYPLRRWWCVRISKRAEPGPGPWSSWKGCTSYRFSCANVARGPRAMPPCFNAEEGFGRNRKVAMN